MSTRMNMDAVKPLDTADAAERALSRQYIDETLSIYRTEYVYLDSATWSAFELTGRFRLEHYPFTKEEHIDYVTASMLMLYLSQLGFIYTRILCEEDLLPSGFNITTQEFFRLRDEGQIVFVGLDKIRLRQRIPISKALLQVKMRLHREYALRGTPIGELSFEVAGGVFAGEARVAIILN